MNQFPHASVKTTNICKKIACNNCKVQKTIIEKEQKTNVDIWMDAGKVFAKRQNHIVYRFNAQRCLKEGGKQPLSSLAICGVRK